MISPPSAADIRESGISVDGRATTRDGVSLFYRLFSTGPSNDLPWVVLIHSLALDSSVWHGVIADLVRSARILAIDCRGHGRSERVQGPYTVDMFGDDIADVMNHLGVSKALIAGCSMGGCVAQALAARHAGLVSGLVLIDTTAWYGEGAPETWQKRANAARTDGLSSLGPFQATRWFGDEFRARNAKRVDDIMAIFVKNDIECYAATCKMLGEADLRPQLSFICVPTSVIVGEEDYATPIVSARNLQELIKGATLKIVPKARHLTPIEVPEVICEEILVRLRKR
jgi:3-oxoadipate enol-lactonase